MEENYLICEDSLEGIFTGIYEAYALRREHERIHIQVGEEENLRLFAAYMEIQPDQGKAAKVAETINRRLGGEAYLDICRALACEDGQKGEAVYKMVVCGLRMKDGREIMGNLANSYVHKVFELARFTRNEVHHWKEFLRFQEFAVHPKSKEWYLVTARDFEEEKIAPYSEGELEYQELFAFFCHKIAIKERKNLKLQRNMMPLRFQEYMVEFGQ